MQMQQPVSEVETGRLGFAASKVAHRRLDAAAGFSDLRLRHPGVDELVDDLLPVHLRSPKHRIGDIVTSAFPIVNIGKVIPMAQPKKPRDRSAFGERMNQARKAAGLMQMDVCGLLNIAQSTLSEAEGSAAGSSYTVQFARLYKVDPYWLATGEGDKAAIVLSDDERALVLAYRIQRGSNVISLPHPPASPNGGPGIRYTKKQKRRPTPKKKGRS